MRQHQLFVAGAGTKTDPRRYQCRACGRDFPLLGAIDVECEGERPIMADNGKLDESLVELHRRANLYAAQAVADINAHRYHGHEATQHVLTTQLETDIARAFVYGYCARIEDEAKPAHRGGRK